MAFLSSKTNLPEARRVSARLQNPHKEFKVRLATHLTPIATMSSLDRIQALATDKWTRGGTVPFSYMLRQVFLSPPSAEFPVIQFGPAWDINTVFRALGLRQFAMVGPNTARTVLLQGETLDNLLEDIISTNNELGKKKLAPLFLSLSLEQGGEFCWRHRPLLELKVAKPRGSAQAGFGGPSPCGIKVFITGLSVELKLDYVIDILSKIGISDKNNPHWAVTSDEISVIEADISSWGDVKAQQFEDVKRAVSVSVFSADDWPLDSVITERTPLQGERQAPDSKALEGLADYDLSPEQARMFKAITNKHGWGVPPTASGAVANGEKQGPRPKQNVVRKPAPPLGSTTLMMAPSPRSPRKQGGQSRKRMEPVISPEKDPPPKSRSHRGRRPPPTLPNRPRLPGMLILGWTNQT